ncbi:MAG: phosphoglucosamine mutase [bacterium]
MTKIMVSVSGVRGIVGEGLAPEVIMSFAQAFGTYLKGGTVVVARDSRVTGEMVQNAVTAGLLAVGCDILDVGICPTPTAQLAVENLKAKGGVIITASHNPIMWNGLKLIGEDGLFLDAEQGQEVLRISRQSDFPLAAWDKIGVRVTYSKAVDEHIEAILALKCIDVDRIKSRRFKVVLDCIAGAGSVLLPNLLHRLGCVVAQLNCEPTGLFRRNPEPLPENLAELSDRVRAEQADLGIAVDPDSDRLALVSEKGEPLGEERTLALAVKCILEQTRGPVVINASTSRVNEDLAFAADVPLFRTRVGEVNVARKMREVGAVIGGEGNGGVILPELHLGRDAPVGVALTLHHLAGFRGPLSALDDSLPGYCITKEKVKLENLEPQTALDRIRENHAGEELDFTDGIKIIREKSWVHIRASNTEPIIRVIAEAPTKKEAARLCKEFKDQI